MPEKTLQCAMLARFCVYQTLTDNHVFEGIRSERQLMELGEVALTALREVAQGLWKEVVQFESLEVLTVAVSELFKVAWESPTDDDLGLDATMNLLKLLDKSRD